MTRPRFPLLPSFLFLLFSFLSPALAQTEGPISGADPEAVADEAVGAWLGTASPGLLSLAGLSPDELCERLPALLQNPPPGGGHERQLE